MIISYPFGYALRHKIYYNTETKRGTVTFWSSYSGSLTGTDPTVNGDSFLPELFAHQNAFKGTLFGTNQYSEIQIGDERDVFLLLAALVLSAKGRDFSFSSLEGRKLSFSLVIEGSAEKEIITIKVQYGKAGKLTLDEANRLEFITREILQKAGFSIEEIKEGVEKIMAGASE